MKKLNDSIIDTLDNKPSVIKADISNNEELMIPQKCAFCRENVICSVLPTLIGLSRINIVIGVEECPYYVPTESQELKLP